MCMISIHACVTRDRIGKSDFTCTFTLCNLSARLLSPTLNKTSTKKLMEEEKGIVKRAGVRRVGERSTLVSHVCSLMIYFI